MPDLLFEIGTEELPASCVEPALSQLALELRARLADRRLAPADLRTAGTPRRLTVFAAAVPDAQESVSEELVGPPARVALDPDGNHTKAALGFARKAGVAPEELTVKTTPKGDYLCAVRHTPGRPAIEILPDLLAECAARIVFPKSMYWHDRAVTFARPVRSLLALLDDALVPVRFAGVEADRNTAGHPFLDPGPFEVPDADFDRYLRILRDAYVIADPDERRALIREQVDAILHKHGAALDPRDEPLLEEVTHLVECPCALEGRFEPEFLRVPTDIVVAALKGHQRCFPVRTGENSVEPAFVVVTNRTPAQADLVREGNQRVIRARLDDARFFWDEERHHDLEELVERLRDVSFLRQLGSNYDRALRLRTVAGRIAEALGYSPDQTALAQRAALLAKADLVTGLVAEFPDLQGVIGREMARVQDERPEVAEAIAEHYLPRGAADRLPHSPTGVAVSLADRIDVITGCFSVDLLPSGSQDPYALRRNANAILRILQERRAPLPLTSLINMALDAGQTSPGPDRLALADRILEFFRDRLMQLALDAGFTHDLIRAVMAAAADNVPDFWLRLQQLADCAREPWWNDLVEVVERTWRIHKGEGLADHVDPELLAEPAERELWDRFCERRDELRTLAERADYREFSRAFADALAAPVHRFFDEVFVNVDDPRVRSNRLTLCARIHELYASRAADLALIGQG
jgi:glycyl-tRNA synthetase beta chain